MEIRFIFEGSGPNLRFVEAEDEHGNSVQTGYWTTDGRFQCLHVNVEECEVCSDISVGRFKDRPYCRYHLDMLE